MSLSSDNMMKLMAYADGELEGAELDEAHKLLATDGDAVRFVEQVAGLGHLVSLGHEARSAKTIAAFDIADAVMAAVPQKHEAKKLAGGSVSSLAAAREKRGNGLKIGAGIAASLALAASIFVFTQHRTEETPMAKAPVPAAVQPSSPSPSPSNTVASNSPAGSGVEVSTVESAGNSVSVFYLPSANELSTSVVVWVDETGEK